ncbi:MAG: DUF1842 domain-containing protein [Kordia sp.]|uniref:DUF1842 domain-containing protein n=1 Tax=Kordia sp. TaxID=1965332 RepID=UPI00385EBF16
MSNSVPNVFLLNLLIGESMAGAITCRMNLGVSPQTKTVQGRSVVFQAVNPPLHVESAVTGTYNYLCTNTSCHIMIIVNGYTENEKGSLKNFEARILLEDNWETGTANYSFLRDGEWVTMSNQVVRAMPNNEINDLGKLAEAANH